MKRMLVLILYVIFLLNTFMLSDEKMLLEFKIHKQLIHESGNPKCLILKIISKYYGLSRKTRNKLMHALNGNIYIDEIISVYREKGMEATTDYLFHYINMDQFCLGFQVDTKRDIDLLNYMRNLHSSGDNRRGDLHKIYIYNRNRISIVNQPVNLNQSTVEVNQNKDLLNNMIKAQKRFDLELKSLREEIVRKETYNALREKQLIESIRSDCYKIFKVELDLKIAEMEAKMSEQKLMFNNKLNELNTKNQNLLREVKTEAELILAESKLWISRGDEHVEQLLRKMTSGEIKKVMSEVIEGKTTPETMLSISGVNVQGISPTIIQNYPPKLISELISCGFSSTDINAYLIIDEERMKLILNSSDDSYFIRQQLNEYKGKLAYIYACQTIMNRKDSEKVRLSLTMRETREAEEQLAYEKRMLIQQKANQNIELIKASLPLAYVAPVIKHQVDNIEKFEKLIDEEKEKETKVEKTELDLKVDYLMSKASDKKFLDITEISGSDDDQRKLASSRMAELRKKREELRRKEREEKEAQDKISAENFENFKKERERIKMEKESKLSPLELERLRMKERLSSGVPFTEEEMEESRLELNLKFPDSVDSKKLAKKLADEKKLAEEKKSADEKQIDLTPYKGADDDLNNSLTQKRADSSDQSTTGLARGFFNQKSPSNLDKKKVKTNKPIIKSASKSDTKNVPIKSSIEEKKINTGDNPPPIQSASNAKSTVVIEDLGAYDKADDKPIALLKAVGDISKYNTPETRTKEELNRIENQMVLDRPVDLHHPLFKKAQERIVESSESHKPMLREIQAEMLRLNCNTSDLNGFKDLDSFFDLAEHKEIKTAPNLFNFTQLICAMGAYQMQEQPEMLLLLINKIIFKGQSYLILNSLRSMFNLKVVDELKLNLDKLKNA